MDGSSDVCSSDLLHRAPDGYDSDVWADIARADLETLVAVEPHDGVWSEADLYAAVARLNMRRLDLSGPPFAAHLFERLAGGGSALYLKMHHSVADGIGFQTILGLLRSEEHTSELQSLMRISYAVFCLKKKNNN